MPKAFMSFKKCDVDHADTWNFLPYFVLEFKNIERIKPKYLNLSN